MGSKLEAVHKIEQRADIAIDASAKRAGKELISKLNKAAGESTEQIISALKLDVKSGRILLTAKNMAAIEKAMLKGIPAWHDGLRLVEGASTAWAESSAAFGAKVFVESMRVVAAKGWSLTTNPLLIQVSRARVLNYATSLTQQAQTRVHGAVLAYMRNGGTQAKLAAIVRKAGGVSEPLARTIARSEVMATYRAASTAQYEHNGYEHYEFVGPSDSVTSPECQDQIGKIRTRSEWLDIASLIFEYGLHPNCRHKLIGVQKDWMDDDEWENATK